MPGNSIKNHRIYAALRRKGYSKTKSARISNAMAGGGGKRRGKGGRKR